MIGAKEARALYSKHLDETNIRIAAFAWMEDNLDEQVRQSTRNGFTSLSIKIPVEYAVHCVKELGDLGYYLRAMGTEFENDKQVQKVYISW